MVIDLYLPIVVRKLSAFASDLEDVTLCPDLTLEVFDHWRCMTIMFGRENLNRNRFFIPACQSSKVVCKNTTSAWIVSLMVHKAYANASKSGVRLCKLSLNNSSGFR